ncbi:MAG: S8 family serine peptidase [Deltaproteobacteria bacterium]|nr:S8 family serine peptidase [Deltaproteobacteria bacterium]
MFLRSISTVLFSVLIAVGTANAATFDAALEDALNAARPGETINAYITLADRVDLSKLVREMDRRDLNRAQRHYLVVTELQDRAAETQGALLSSLNARLGTDVAYIKSFWIANAVAIEATPAFIETLRPRTDIASVYLDAPIQLIEPVDASLPIAASAAAGIAPGIQVARAPELWALGIDGTGTLACDQDTGADGTHPAFADRWRGLDGGVDPSAAWFDPVASETFPTDSGSHGTHTLGTILGNGPTGQQIGMAPGAKWIGAKTIDIPGGNIYSDAVAAFQWMADPDGNPVTVEDVPDAVNNSWGIPISICNTDFYDSIDAAEAAGVIVVFAAGNEGPFPKSLRYPANRITTDLNAFAVGALKQGGQEIAGFSSRGPSRCDHQTIKPEVAAVGDNVISSTPERLLRRAERNVDGGAPRHRRRASSPSGLSGSHGGPGQNGALRHGDRPWTRRRRQHLRPRTDRRRRSLLLASRGNDRLRRANFR